MVLSEVGEGGGIDMVECGMHQREKPHFRQAKKEAEPLLVKINIPVKIVGVQAGTISDLFTLEMIMVRITGSYSFVPPSAYSK